MRYSHCKQEKTTQATGIDLAKRDTTKLNPEVDGKKFWNC